MIVFNLNSHIWGSKTTFIASLGSKREPAMSYIRIKAITMYFELNFPFKRLGFENGRSGKEIYAHFNEIKERFLFSLKKKKKNLKGNPVF